MKKTKRRADSAELILLLTLSADAASLGATNGYQFFGGTDGKHARQTEGSFSLLLLDDGCGGSACRITVPRPFREWETVSRKDYYSLTDALTQRYIAAAEAQTGLPLTAHLSELHVITPPEAAMRANEQDAPLSLVYRKLFPERQTMLVAAVRTENGATQIDLQKTDGFSAAPFRAGQCVRLTPQTDDTVCVTLPLCGASSSASQGIYTVASTSSLDRLAGLQAGDAVTVSSPFGPLFLRPVRDHETVIGMTDRTGLPSFLSMAKAILEGTEKHKLTVLYFSDGKDCPFERDFQEIVDACARIRLIRFPTEEEVDCESFFRSMLPHETFTVFIAGSDAARTTIRNTIAPLQLAANCVKEFPTDLSDIL